jgi:hypothetical protein
MSYHAIFNKTQLKGLCQLLGESVTAGQRCRLDGLCKLFITIHYSRYAFTRNTSLLAIAGGCDPLLCSLIARCNPYKRHYDGGEEDNASISSNDNNSETAVVINKSDFEDSDGCLWRVTSKSTLSVVAKCIYPKLHHKVRNV